LQNSEDPSKLKDDFADLCSEAGITVALIVSKFITVLEPVCNKSYFDQVR